MKDLNIINLNQLTWPLNIAIGGAVFSVFSLVYNDHYIYYGFATVVFGILGHMAVIFFDWCFHIDESHKYADQRLYWIAHVTNILLCVLWVLVLLQVY